jgi:hypothetical protein
MSNTVKTTWRRLYVFLAVALAVFLASLTAVGLACHGFACSTVANVQQTAQDTQTVPEDMKSPLAHASEQAKAAYQAAQSAVDQYQATDVELQDLLDTHFSQLLMDTDHLDEKVDVKKVDALEPNELNSASDKTSISKPAPPQMVINPRWQELHERINQLQAQREKLAATMLPTHPEMQALVESIADLQQQIALVPKEISSETADNPFESQQKQERASHQAKLSETSKTDVLAALQPCWEKTAHEYHELTERLQAQKSQCYCALDTESDAWQRKAEIPTRYIAAVMTGRFASAPIGANARTAIYCSGLLAIVLGLLVAQGARVPEAVFRSVAEVRQRLGISLLGMLPARTAAQASERPISEARWVSRVLLAAELSLLAVVVLLTVLSLADGHFFNQLLANPLAACSQKFFC